MVGRVVSWLVVGCCLGFSVSFLIFFIMLVRFIGFGGFLLTYGRHYRALALDGAFYVILDDNGDERRISVNWFDLV